MFFRAVATAAGLVLAGVASAEAQPDPDVRHVRVTARIVTLDRDAFTRAGVSYVVVGSDRVRVAAGERRRLPRPFQAADGASPFRISAFLDAARRSRWVSAEHTQQVLTLSGSEAWLSSAEVAMGHGSARARGPEMAVTPTVLPDGRVHLRVSVRLRDTATGPWGQAVEGGRVAAETEVVVRDGEEAVLASAVSSEAGREVGLLRIGAWERERDVLVVLTPRVVD